LLFRVGDDEECEGENLRAALSRYGPYVEASRPVHVEVQGREPPAFLDVLTDVMGWEIEEGAEVELELSSDPRDNRPHVLHIRPSEDPLIAAMKAHGKVFGEPVAPVVAYEGIKAVAHVAVHGRFLAYTVTSVWETLGHVLTGVSEAGVGTADVLKEVRETFGELTVMRAAPGPVSWVPGAPEASPGGCAVLAARRSKNAFGDTLWSL